MLTQPAYVSACLAIVTLVSATAVAEDPIPQKAEMAGYLLVPHERVDKKYTGIVSPTNLRC